MKTFYNVVSSMICRAKKVRASIDLNIFKKSLNLCFKIVKNCILSEVCMIKTAPHSTVFL